MIELKNVSVFFKNGFFKKLQALDNINLRIEKGSIFGLLGPNGAGKSTAMYCMLGLIKPDKGSIRIMGQPVYPGAKIFKKIGYLPEEPHYHLYLTIEEALRYYTELYGMDISNQKLYEWLEKFGLLEFKRLKLANCSKGMKQKVGIIQALINEETEILFLDEPTRGLDPITTKILRDCLLERSKNGTTIILNSHILSEVEMICDKVAILDKGRVKLHGELKTFLTLEEETYIVEFQYTEQIPEYIMVREKTACTIKGFINKQNLKDFLNFIFQNNLKLYQCELKKISLEEAFYNIFKKGITDEKANFEQYKN